MPPFSFSNEQIKELVHTLRFRVQRLGEPVERYRLALSWWIISNGPGVRQALHCLPSEIMTERFLKEFEKLGENLDFLEKVSEAAKNANDFKGFELVERYVQNIKRYG